MPACVARCSVVTGFDDEDARASGWESAGAFDDHEEPEEDPEEEPEEDDHYDEEDDW